VRQSQPHCRGQEIAVNLPAPPAQATGSPSPARRKRKAARVAATPIVLACLALAACGSSDGPGAEPAPATVGTVVGDELADEASKADSPVVLGPEPRTVEPESTIKLADNLNGLVLTDDAVWVGTVAGIMRVDPETNRTIRQIDVPNLAGYFAIAFGSAWVVDYDKFVVRRVDPRSGKVVAEIPTGANPEGIGFTEDAIWVANHRDGTVTRVDPSTDSVVATISVGKVGIGGPQQLLATTDTVFVGVPNQHSVVKIDAATNQVTDVIPTQGGGCGNLFLADGHVWAGGCDYSIDTIDLATNKQIGRVLLGGQGGAAFEFQDHVWMSVLSEPRSEPGHLIAINPTTFAIEDSIVFESSTYPVALGFDSVWVAIEGTGELLRLPITSLTRQ
jgi:YVTN family beta-propeller protein